MRHDIIIRPETPADLAGIRGVNQRAFPTPAEAALVDALRAAGAVTLSLVAAQQGDAERAGGDLGDHVVGHILFSPVTITTAAGPRTAVGLAPMAVDPAWQRHGIGARLVQAGITRLGQAGHPAVVVLGHPDYYPRFGFARASSFGLRWEHPCADAAFMALALAPHALDGCAGVVRYRPEFDAVS
jgi:putative acetyltransferase